MNNALFHILKLGKTYLDRLGIENSKHESRLIISKEIKKSESEIILNKSLLVSEKQKKKFLHNIYKRMQGKPISRIYGSREFYSRDFYINKHTLDPRHDSELIVETVLDIINKKKKKNINILDLGTGSGCLIISIILESKKIDKNICALGADISNKALEIAVKNKKKYNIGNELSFINSNWCSSINQKFDIILSNPPYIKTNRITNLSNSVKNFDPLLALDGGIDGYKCFEEIIALVKDYLFEDGFLCLEIGKDQLTFLKKLIKRNNLVEYKINKDLSGVNRVLVLRLKQKKF